MQPSAIYQATTVASNVVPALTINGYQLRDALSAIAPDGTAAQMECSICIQPGASRRTSSGQEPAGLFCWLEEFPEEGSFRLDEFPRNSRLADPHDEKVLLAAHKLIEAARWVYGNAEARRQPDARALAKVVMRLMHPFISDHIDNHKPSHTKPAILENHHVA